MGEHQYVLLTDGEYSSYGVDGLLRGPAEPSIADLEKAFEDAYCPGLKDAERARPRDYRTMWARCSGIVEAGRLKLQAQGVPVDARPNAYGMSKGGLFEAWLRARCGFEEVAYTEVHDGTVK